jgi:hypothetical protein
MDLLPSTSSIDAFLEWADSLLFGLEKTRFRRLMKSTEPPCHALANITYAWGVRSLYAQSVMNNSVSTYVHALIGHENQFLTKAISYMQDQTKAQDHYTKMEYIQANILLGLHCFTFGNWPQIDHYVSSAVALSTELRINLHPNQVPTYEIYDFTTQKEHSKLFWCLFELDCCNVAAVQGMSHFFGTKLQISAPDPYNSIPGNGQTYTPDEFLQGSAAKFSSNFGKSLKIAYLTMWSEQLLKGQASFTTSHPDFHSVMAAAIQTQGSLEKLNEYPTEDKVSEVASTQIIAFALFEHLHLYEYMIKTAVPRDQIARIRAWALENIAKIINTVGQSKLKYLKPHAAVSFQL